LVARVELGRSYVVDHGLRHGSALTSEQVERHAAGNGETNVHVTECEFYFRDVVAIIESLLGLVVRVRPIDVPFEFIAEVQNAVQTHIEIISIDILVKDSRADFDRTS